jgi:hypothetical protein
MAVDAPSAHSPLLGPVGSEAHIDAHGWAVKAPSTALASLAVPADVRQKDSSALLGCEENGAKGARDRLNRRG